MWSRVCQVRGLGGDSVSVERSFFEFKIPAERDDAEEALLHFQLNPSEELITEIDTTPAIRHLMAEGLWFARDYLLKPLGDSPLELKEMAESPKRKQFWKDLKKAVNPDMYAYEESHADL